MPETIVVDGMSLLAERPASPTRVPLLFVPGYFAGASVFDEFLRRFAARGHPSYAVNLRGRPGSRPVTLIGRVRLDDYVADAAEAVRWVQAQPDHGAASVVVGHSMGGLVAQKLAERGALPAVVLLAPAPPRGIPLLSLRLMLRQLRYLPATLASRPVSPRFEDIRDLVLNRVPPAGQRPLFEQLMADSGRAGRDMLLGAVAVDERRVRCPMLVVAGDDDHFIPFRIAERVARKYGASLRRADGHGHMLPKEPGWERIAAWIEEWLEGQRSASSG